MAVLPEFDYTNGHMKCVTVGPLAVICFKIGSRPMVEGTANGHRAGATDGLERSARD